MNSVDDLDVYILWAGCSVAAGYPLAFEMRDKLDEFGKTVATSSPNVSQWCAKTADRMREYNTDTLV